MLDPAGNIVSTVTHQREYNSNYPSVYLFTVKRDQHFHKEKIHDAEFCPSSSMAISFQHLMISV